MQEFISAIACLAIYFVIAASLALLLRFTVRIPDELFRKLLHCILLGSLAVWVEVFSTWYLAAASAILFALVVYPVLCLAERLRNYSKVVTERRSGELKASLLLVFFMFAFVVAVCWGIFGDKLLVLACVFGWGFGDAAAALVGKRFGKHKINGRWLDGRKSFEGTAAMFSLSFVSVLTVLLLRGGAEFWPCVIIAALAAAASSAAELYTRNGMDTVTCPIAAMAVILPLVHFLGGGL